jgi:hypothetical protein
MPFSPSLIAIGMFYVLIQVAAALPWVLVLTWDTLRAWSRPAPRQRLLTLAGGLVGAVVVGGGLLGGAISLVREPNTVGVMGRVYAIVLQLQLTADLFVAVFAAGFLCPVVEWAAIVDRTRWLVWGGICLGAVLGVWLLYYQVLTDWSFFAIGTRAWFVTTVVGVLLGVTFIWFLSEGRPKLFAVARAAFRESYRQPMFWLIVGVAVFLLSLVFPHIPYFTFGEDHLMMKENGYDTVMLAAVAFGAIAASMSISEEIEGRTAVTLMSKPVSRRQFLLGKFLGILLACLVMVSVLSWFFDLVLLYKYDYDSLPTRQLVPPVVAWIDRVGGPFEARNFLRGVVFWVFHAGELLPGQVMSASLVMVLVAVAVALATRLPMIVNLVTCLVIYFLANLMPVLVKTTKPANEATAGPVQKLVYFMAQLFDALLPGLELFRVRPTLVDEGALPIDDYLRHVGAVTGYGILFTTIVLLVGLVLFEDRDLA